MEYLTSAVMFIVEDIRLFSLECISLYVCVCVSVCLSVHTNVYAQLFILSYVHYASFLTRTLERTYLNETVSYLSVENTTNKHTS